MSAWRFLAPSTPLHCLSRAGVKKKVKSSKEGRTSKKLDRKKEAPKRGSSFNRKKRGGSLAASLFVHVVGGERLFKNRASNNKSEKGQTIFQHFMVLYCTVRSIRVQYTILLHGPLKNGRAQAIFMSYETLSLRP